MNKQIILGVLISISLNSFSQKFDFKEPDNVKKKITTMDYYYPNPVRLSDTIGISDYDSHGNTIRTIHFSDKLIQSNSLYHFDNNNRLIEYVDFGRRGYQTVTDPKTGKESEISEYDSTITILIKKYKYDNDNLKQLDWYEFGKNLTTSVIYEYDNSNRITKELQISYPNPNTLVYFKPNSTEIDWNHPRQENIEVNTKTCRYSGNFRLCEYFDSINLVSIDTTIFENELMKRNVIYRKTGERIFEALYIYNDQNKLIEYRTIDSGKSAYGGEYDMIASDKIKYRYDRNGYLVEEEYYVDNKISTKIHYYYFE